MNVLDFNLMVPSLFGVLGVLDLCLLHGAGVGVGLVEPRLGQQLLQGGDHPVLQKRDMKGPETTIYVLFYWFIQTKSFIHSL